MALNQGTVTALSAAKLASGTQTAQMGYQGDGYISDVHGRYYTAARMGKMFVGSSLIAGVTIPVNTATAATFTLFNPIASTAIVELISFDYGYPVAAASVVGTLLLSMATQTPTSVTSGGATVCGLLGTSATAQAQIYTAATIAACTQHLPLFTIETTANASRTTHYDFEGKIIIAPGGMVHITSTPVQTAVGIPSFCWAEWPIN